MSIVRQALAILGPKPHPEDLRNLVVVLSSLATAEQRARRHAPGSPWYAMSGPERCRAIISEALATFDGTEPPWAIRILQGLPADATSPLDRVARD